jgi:5-methyltetrahydropteroyltriglutamate--homocysteine methyltransferase
MALLTTTIGSFPKPPELAEARRRFADGGIDAATLRFAEDEATRRTIEIQREAGVDLLVDGEMDRADPITSFTERMASVEIAGWVRVYGDRYVRKPKIVGPVGRGAATTVERWRFARDAAPGPVKAVIPGPYTLMDGSFDEHYASRRRACEAFAEVVRAEVIDLAAAGAREIQIDEPSAGARPGEVPLLREAVEHVLHPVRGRARTWIWLGYADLPRDGAALAMLPADGILVAGAHNEYEGLEAFAAALPDDRFAGVGVVDVLDARVEARDTIAARIRRVASSIPADRLWVVPDGGFRSLAAEAAREKLRTMVAAARSWSE